MLAALAILAGGCASRRAVDRLGSDVGRLRSELAEMRVAQEVTSRDLANVTSQLQALDVRTLGDEVARLTRRADAADSALAATQTKVEALATQPGSTPPSGRPATSPVPAPMSPDPAVMSPVPAPTPPTPTVMSPVPAPVPPAPASVSPPPAPAPPPPAVGLPAPSPTPAAPPAAAIERPRVAPAPAPTGAPPTTSAPAPNVARAPTPSPAPTVAPTPNVTSKPTPKAGDNPEQEYAAALATFRSREHGQAVLDFIDFMAKYPKHPLAGNAQYWIGEAYWAQRDYRQALAEFEKVFEHGPGKTPDALLKIGLCHLRLTDLPRAQQAWQRVVSEYPKSESATMARSLIATHSAARR
ncbi:MAG: tol-pal system protein YbgF [Candidatus Rokuibacteriota bacterium]|nr:MAG: tol-pal system protein YbgF [Candidatus Rokubacteria bacterium]PYO13217.1 MAG: tol-pal system protein YbgF [Candidatus Rokubacteria bacterium]